MTTLCCEKFVMSPAAAPSRRIHVLYVIDQLEGIGGGEGALLKTVRLLPKDQFRCSVATLKGVIPEQVRAKLACPAYALNLGRAISWNGVRTALRLRNLIQSEQVNIVHTFFESANTWGALAAKLGGARFLVSSRRDMGILRRSKHRLAYRIVNRFKLLATEPPSSGTSVPFPSGRTGLESTYEHGCPDAMER